MKLLAVCALTLALANAATFEMPPKGELRSRNSLVPAGSPQGRISRGMPAQAGQQFPYQVGLLVQAANGVGSWCGGSLLNNRKVLTAAHCTAGMKTAFVYLGATRPESPEVVHSVTSKNFTIHSGWHRENLSNDISIIDIPYTPYTTNIQPVKLPTIGSYYSSYNGDEIIAPSWGRAADYSSEIGAHMTVIPNKVCSSYFGSDVDSSTICSAADGDISTCSGDSGGPLVLAATKIQIGLTSFKAREACEKNVPVVNTRLTSYLDWIKENS